MTGASTCPGCGYQFASPDGRPYCSRQCEGGAAIAALLAAMMASRRAAPRR